MPWAIEKTWLPIILSAATDKGDLVSAKHKNEAYALQLNQGDPLEGSTYSYIRDGVAVINVFGPIIPRANFFSRVSAITSTDLIAQDIKSAVDSHKVNSIILNLDTPGGAAKGINELSQFISSLDIPIKAYVGGSADSAGYWIASAADEIIIDETADIGSIGVVMAGESKNPKPGTSQWKIISSNAPKKHLEPESKEGREDYLRIINSLEKIFIQTVADNRNVTTDTVINDFGQGSVLIGSDAVAAGMADRIGSLEGLIDELSADNRSNNSLRKNYMTTKKDAADNVVITKKLIEDDHKDIADAFRAEGKKSVDVGLIKKDAIAAERGRISKITSLSRKGYESIVKTGIDEGDSPESVSMKILTEMNDRGITVEDINADSTSVNSSASDAIDDSDEKSGNWDAALSKAGVKTKK